MRWRRRCACGGEALGRPSDLGCKGLEIPPPRGGTLGKRSHQDGGFTVSSPDRHDSTTQCRDAAAHGAGGPAGAGGCSPDLEGSCEAKETAARRRARRGARNGGGRRRGGRESERRPLPRGRRSGEGLPQHGQVRDLPAGRRHGPVGDHDRPQLSVRRRRPPAGYRHAAADRRHHDLRAAGGRSQQARVRDRLRRFGHGLGDRAQDFQRPHLDDGQDRPDTADDLRAGRQEGLGDRQCLDRGDHGRHARGARLARQRARLPGPDRHGRVPEVQEVGGRPRLDRRAGGRPLAPTSSSAAARGASIR